VFVMIDSHRLKIESQIPEENYNFTTPISSAIGTQLDRLLRTSHAQPHAHLIPGHPARRLIACESPIIIRFRIAQHGGMIAATQYLGQMASIPFTCKRRMHTISF